MVAVATVGLVCGRRRQEPHLIPIARRALEDPLPAGWTEARDPDTGAVVYKRIDTGEVRRRSRRRSCRRRRWCRRTAGAAAVAAAADSASAFASATAVLPLRPQLRRP